MASTTYPRDFMLSSHQQELLLAALNAGNTAAPVTARETQSQTQYTPTASALDRRSQINDDWNLEGDGGLDFDDGDDDGQLIGAMPGSSADADAQEMHEKRSHPDDDEEEDEDGGGKRREGDDKASKKPGRKPINSEPTTKRKAQNRAAQRAFRERKEKHLKDLETKVQDLEQASESANHENAILRAQVEKMAAELKEQRALLAASNGIAGQVTELPSYLLGTSIGNPVSHLNDVNFGFDFPQFGTVPAGTGEGDAMRPPAQMHRSSTASMSDSVSLPGQMRQLSSGYGSISESLMEFPESSGTSAAGTNMTDISAFSSLLSPTTFNNLAKDYPFDPVITTTSQRSVSSANSVRDRANSSRTTVYNSPGESSASGSHNGPTSSCGTSPEPTGQSPQTKQSGASAGELSYGESLGRARDSANNAISMTPDQSNTMNQYRSGYTPGVEFGSFDWLGAANTTFDPQLFNDYRESQDSILAGNGLYDDSFFNEAIQMPDFGSPLTTNSMLGTKSPQPPKKNLVAQIDAKLNNDDEIVSNAGQDTMLSCDNMWAKIQNCPSVQSGEIDMDLLCSQLQQKAKCSGQGPVINETDFKQVIKSMFPADKPCPMASTESK